jgi:hypothetical protein
MAVKEDNWGGPLTLLVIDSTGGSQLRACRLSPKQGAPAINY